MSYQLALEKWKFNILLVKTGLEVNCVFLICVCIMYFTVLNYVTDKRKYKNTSFLLILVS